MEHKGKLFFQVACLLVGTLFVLLMGASASFSQGVTIKIGDIDKALELTVDKTNGEYNSSNVKSQAFKRFLELSSNGKIKVEVYPNCQLGSDKEQLEMTQMGSLHMNVNPLNTIANIVPEFNALSIPYLFRDMNVAMKLVDGPIGKELADMALKKIGVRILKWNLEGGYDYMTTKKPFRLPGDLKGVKIRVPQNPAIIEITKLVGASPTPIPWSEVYTSLQQGVVDGVFTGFIFVNGAGLTDLLKNLTVASPFFMFSAMQINEKFYQSLKPEDQYLVKEAAMRANDAYVGLSYWGRDLWLDVFKQKGWNVYVPNAEEMAQWKKAIREPMIEWTKKIAGAAWVDKVVKAAEAAEKELYGDIKLK